MLPGARHAEAGVPAVIVKHDGHVLLLGAGALPLHPPRLQRTLRPQPNLATDLALSPSASPELSWSAAAW